MNYDQMDQNRENVHSFFGDLLGEGYKEKILEKYPNAKWEFLGDNELPKISSVQVWCCNCGCGEKDPVLVPCLNYSVISDEESGDGLLEGHVTGNWQSPCKIYSSDGESFEHFGMFLWDNVMDNEVPNITLEGSW